MGKYAEYAGQTGNCLWHPPIRSFTKVSDLVVPPDRALLKADPAPAKFEVLQARILHTYGFHVAVKKGRIELEQEIGGKVKNYPPKAFNSRTPVRYFRPTFRPTKGTGFSLKLQGSPTIGKRDVSPFMTAVCSL